MVHALEHIDVFILCGGKGTRLREICRGIPKPMVSMGTRPFLDCMIDYLAGFGFRRFILGIGYKGRVIQDYYAGGKEKGRTIIFSQEKRPLDTGGAIKKAKKLIKSNPFFVLNGDSFSRFNPVSFLEFHKRRKALVSILLRRASRAQEFGRIGVDKSFRILSFSEKNAQAQNGFINAGVYIFDREVFSSMPLKPAFSLERDFFPAVSGKNVFGYYKPGFFIDIGTPERYYKARKYFSRRRR